MAAGWCDGPKTIVVPASSANLGPGFDSFALALDLTNEVTAEVAGSDLVVDVDGEGADQSARDETHLVVRAARATFAELGVHPPGLRLTCRDRIPHGRGLGSSSAAIVAGVLAARALVDNGAVRLGDDAVLRLAARIEGHSDNVAAALLGGFTITWSDASGARAARITPMIDALVLVPQHTLATATARAMLPAGVSHRDAAHSAGRAGLLVAAVTGQPDLLFAATDDRLHQSHRASAMPQTAELLTALRALGHAAVISGAGPSVVVLHPVGARPHLDVLLPTGWRVWSCHPTHVGARLLS